MFSQESIRLSISEAAKLFGVNAQTIRRAIKKNEITYIVVQDRYKISFESLVAWSQRHATINNKMQTRGIGQFVGQWKIKNTPYTPATEPFAARPTAPTRKEALDMISPLQPLLLEPEKPAVASVPIQTPPPHSAPQPKQRSQPTKTASNNNPTLPL